jgi:hypothetical protein
MSTAREPLTPAQLRSRVVISVPEYAATFDADERTVRRAIREGQIQALQIGDIWRIPVAPLLRQCGLDLENSDAGGGTPANASTSTPPSDRSYRHGSG